MSERVCTKCKKPDGPFGKRKARCNPCLAEDQKRYVAKQSREKYVKKQRKHNAAYRIRLRIKGIKRVIKRRAPEYYKERWDALRSKIIEKYGGKCGKCGFSDPRALQVDHVHGGGSVERKTWSSNNTYYKRVLEDATGKYQLLCANCNWIKRYENKEGA